MEIKVKVSETTAKGVELLALAEELHSKVFDTVGEDAIISDRWNCLNEVSRQILDFISESVIDNLGDADALKSGSVEL